MKLKYDIAIQEVADKFVAVAKNGETEEVEKVFTLNETGVIILRALMEGADTPAIVSQLLAEYDVSPQEAEAEIRRQRETAGITEPRNLEEQAISLVGMDIYEKLVKGYTEKQWGRPCTELPAFIIRRLPVRFTFDNNYFNARFQGIPVEGYTALVEKLLSGADIILNTDYLQDKSKWDALADTVLYTGAIDRYFNYCLGPLQYRSVRFETEVLDIPNYQGNAVINYTDRQNACVQ